MTKIEKQLKTLELPLVHIISSIYPIGHWCNRKIQVGTDGREYVKYNNGRYYVTEDKEIGCYLSENEAVSKVERDGKWIWENEVI